MKNVLLTTFILIFLSSCIDGDCGLYGGYKKGTQPASYYISGNSPSNNTGINTTSILNQWGTGMDENWVTFGNKKAYRDFPTYDGKIGTDINFDFRGQPVLSPLDMKFIGFKNISATQRSSQNKSPYDDIKLCFESLDNNWPGMIICVYHLQLTPLLRKQTTNIGDSCGIVNDWTGSGPEGGEIYFNSNESRICGKDGTDTCGALLGKKLNRGDVIGYAGQVDTSSFAAFEFGVRLSRKNPLRDGPGDPYIHWIQASNFFYFKCFTTNTDFSGGLLAFPYDCGNSVGTNESRYYPDFKY